MAAVSVAWAMALASALTLDDAVRMAVEQHPDVRKARAEARGAGERANEVRSELWPQLGGAAAYQRTTGNFAPRPSTVPSQFIAGQSPSWDTFNFYSVGATLTQLIWDFGRTTGRWDAAKNAARAQSQALAETEFDVALSARTAYFEVLTQRALVRVAKETLENQERHMREIEGFVYVGTRPEIDLAQIRIDRANAEVQLVRSENDHAAALASLDVAMGMAPGSTHELAEGASGAVAGEELEFAALGDEAVRSRPEFARLLALVAAGEDALTASRGSWLPSISAQSSISDVGPSLDTLTWNWNAQVGLTWPLFQGGLTRAQVAEQHAAIEAARAGVEGGRQRLLLAVEQARLAVRAAKASLGATHEAVTNARERLRLAEGRYETGMGSILELGDAQVALTSAQAQAIRAEYTLATARAQLIRALGRP